MKITPLHAAHVALSAKMGEFAGYDMPLYYKDGVLKEHEWVRSHAGIFDVSHMGQITLRGAGVVKLLERLTPSLFASSKLHHAKYTVLTNPQGGIVDDLIVTRMGDEEFFAVINAGCKDKDIEWIKANLPADVTLDHLADRALVAIQGPLAEKVLAEALAIDAAALGYMQLLQHDPCMVSRLGYTGEDGFELSVPQADADTLWQKLLAHPDVKPIGLAARDSLRLEMGYCLYGHDISAKTTPLEADLAWVMGKGNVGYTGAEHVTPPTRKRVGIKLLDKGIAREGAELYSVQGDKIGVMTSGSFSPTLKQSIGQGYVPIEFAAPGTQILVDVRGNKIAAQIETMPFIQPRTKSIKKAA